VTDPAFAHLAALHALDDQPVPASPDASPAPRSRNWPGATTRRAHLPHRRPLPQAVVRGLMDLDEGRQTDLAGVKARLGIE